MGTQSRTSSGTNPVVRFGLIGLMLAVGLAFLLATSVFGIGRGGVFGSHDFTYFTSAGEAWLDGESPYDLDSLNAAADRYYEGTPRDGQVKVESVLFYPPQFFPLAALSGGLPFDASRFGVAAITVISAFAIGWVCLWCYRRDGGAAITLLGSLAMGLAVAQTIGNPFVSHNIWMGQTSVLAAALMLCGFALCCRGWARIGKAVIALGCFKPTLAVAIVPLVLIRWPKQTLIVMPIVGLATAAYPLLTQGPIQHTMDWLAAVSTYRDFEPNQPDFQHYFGVQSLIRSLGVPAPKLIPVAAIAALAVIVFRKRLNDCEQAAFMICIPIVLFQGHDYDLIVLAPAIALLAARLSRSFIGLGLLSAGVLALFMPLRMVLDLEGPPVVARYREIVTVIMLTTLLITTLTRSARESPAIEPNAHDQPK